MVLRKYDIDDFKSWISEGLEVQQTWHAESWEDCQFRDGQHWKRHEIADALKKDINPLTINRIFPIVNLCHGYQVNNQQDIVAKGRTQEDNEISQIMTEGLKYVFDQCEGSSKIMSACHDAIVPGFGYLKVDEHPDPRKEIVTVKSRPWYTLCVDPYGDPFMDPDNCRYAFYSDWKNIDDLIAHYPTHKAQIEEQFDAMSADYLGVTSKNGHNLTFSIQDDVEDSKSKMSGGAWADRARKRIKPVELYYVVKQECLFARLENGAIYEVPESLPDNEQMQILQRAEWIGKATVSKMRVALIVGEYVIEDIGSPHAHDEYPYVPFYGYLDRYGNPFGVPRQLKESAMDINKRRSMALAKLTSKRMLVEEGAVKDENEAYEEMNQNVGLVRVAKDGINRIKIEDLSSLKNDQIELAREGAADLREIAGVNAENLGYQTSAMSGKALQQKTEQSNTSLAVIGDNLNRARKKLGELVVAEIQDKWDGQKVLRITDRVTGKDRFVTINEPIRDDGGEVIEVRNNISNGRFDMTIASKPITDTIREKNVEMLFSAIQKAPPEAIPELVHAAFEISDLPQKDVILSRLRRVLGVEETDLSLSSEEREAMDEEKRTGLQEKNNQDAQLELAERQAALKKLLAEAGNLEEEKVSKAYENGYNIQKKLIAQRSVGLPIETRM